MNELEVFLTSLQARLLNGQRPTEVISPFGIHGVMYGTDEDDNTYATVGFILPNGVYAEIEDGTFGELQGFRIYFDNSGAPDDQS